MELLNGGGWLKPSLLALFFWGLWGFLTKLSAAEVPWQTTMILFGVCTLVIGAFAGPSKPQMDTFHFIALAAGIAGGVGFLYFFVALTKGPASIVIPLTSLYMVVASVLAVILLSEPLTIKKILGILSAILAMVLLAA